MKNKLRQLYNASEEDMTYGIGVVVMGTGPPTPIISVHYCGWSREKLEIVRESFKSGIVLSSTEVGPGVYQVHVATRERISIQHAVGKDKSVLRAPAWDADLTDVDGAAFQVFDANRRRRSGFLLLVQAGAWEFMTAVNETNEPTIVGTILPRHSAVATDHST